VDNDITKHEEEFPHRYRPYRTFEPDGSSKIVYKGSLDSTYFSWAYFKQLKNKGFINKTRLGFVDYVSGSKNFFDFIDRISRLTYTRRLLRYLKRNIKIKNSKPLEYEYNDAALKILEADIASLSQTAQRSNANISFINLPSRSYLNYIKKKGTDGHKMLTQKLNSLVQKHGGKYFSYTDYLLQNNIQTDRLFFDCDPHYDNPGYRVLADYLCKTVLKK
jgi:hypothetical protein